MVRPPLRLMVHEVDLSYKCWCNQRMPITCEMQTVPMDDNGAGGTWGPQQQQFTWFPKYRVSENSGRRGECSIFHCGFRFCIIVFKDIIHVIHSSVHQMISQIQLGGCLTELWKWRNCPSPAEILVSIENIHEMEWLYESDQQRYCNYQMSDRHTDHTDKIKTITAFSAVVDHILSDRCNAVHLY